MEAQNRERYSIIFGEILHEWDRAEHLIKQAERIRGQVVGASINELRYAGRRLVDALQKLHQNSGSEDEILYLVTECKHNCMRAQHDAIDAIVLYVQLALKHYEDEFGIKLIAEAFPQYFDIRAILDEANGIITQSRGRRDNRQASYEQIAENIYPTLIDHYQKLRSGRALFVELMTKQREIHSKETKKHWQQILIPTVVGVLCLFLGIAIQNYAPSKKSEASAVVTITPKKDPSRH